MNYDGVHDLILSESVSEGGTGGLIYHLFLGLGQQQFILIDRFVSKAIAIEEFGTIKRMWSYHHFSSQEGYIRYSYFDSYGIYQTSPSLRINPGDGGTEIGNAIFQAIFNENTVLTLEKVE